MITSQKPYLVRAIYEWCQDNDLTPYLATVVDKLTQVPTQYVNNGQIVLNIAPSATKNLLIDNEWVTFKATFSGITHDIAIPLNNVIAIFAKENSQGMQFEVEVRQAEDADALKKNSGLKLVK